MYFRKTEKVFNDDWVIIEELICPQFEALVHSDLLNSRPVCHYEPHHVTTSWELSHSLRLSLRNLLPELMMANASC